MTIQDREFAKNRIEYLLKISNFALDKHDKEALELAIKALSQEPTDAISRKKAIWVISACDGKSAQIEALEQLPSVTQSGKWITLENRFDLGDRVKCSECGQVFVVGDDVSRKYCPNCGTKMESEE